MSFPSDPLLVTKDQCYDIALYCDCSKNCPDILTNDCGLMLTNSVRNQVLITLGSCKYNWMDFPYVDWDLIRQVPVNSFGLNRIQLEFSRAFQNLSDQVKIVVEFSRRCFLIKIEILGEDAPMISNNIDCFMDVINPDYSLN